MRIRLQRPGVLEPEQRDAPAARDELALLVGGNQQRAQAAETVRVHETGGDQLAERGLRLRTQQCGAAHEIVEERRAMRGEVVEQRARAVRELDFIPRRGRERMPQRPVAARDERDGRRAHRRRADALRGVSRAHSARPDETQAVEPVRVVFVEARGQDVALPGGGGDFVSLELRDDGGETFDAFGFRRARHALPFEQEAHEIRGRYRLDLGAQRLDGVAIDAREQAPLAPFERGRRSGRELAAQHEALAFELQQRDVDVGGAERQRLAQVARRDRAEPLQAAAHQLADGLLARPGFRGMVRRRDDLRIERGPAGR